MKSGIKYVDGMDLHGVIKAGLEDFELDYTVQPFEEVEREYLEIFKKYYGVK